MAGQSLELAPPAPLRYTARFNVSHRDRNARGQLARPRAVVASYFVVYLPNQERR